MVIRPELAFVGNPNTTLDEFPIETFTEGIELLDAYVEHGQEKVDGVIRWFELDLKSGALFKDRSSNSIAPTHALFQLLETEGVGQATWRFRFDGDNAYLWGMVTKHAARQRFRLADITSEASIPPFVTFEAITEEEVFYLAERANLDLLALDMESIVTGKQWSESDPHFTELLGEIAQDTLTVPGITEKGRLLPKVYSHLMSVISNDPGIQ